MTLQELKKYIAKEGARICGTKYKIVMSKDLLKCHTLLGQILHYAHKVILDDTIRMDDLISTLIHEVLESINVKYELDIAHPKITALENGIYAFIKDNPELILKLLETMTSNEAEDEPS